MDFDHEEGIAKIDWNQRKVGTAKEVYYYANAEGNYQLCWYHSLFRVWVCDAENSYLRKEQGKNGGSGETIWMHPVLAFNSKPSSVINAYIKQSLPEGYSGNGYRIGCINHVGEGPGFTTLHQTLISGHDYKGVCTVFEYTLCSGILLRRVCKYLAGASPTNTTATPRLVFWSTLSSSLQDKIKQFLHDIVPHSDYTSNGRLHGITMIAFASWLMHYSRFVTDRGQKHVCVVKFGNMMRLRGIPTACIAEWGEVVRNDFIDQLYMSKEEVISNAALVSHLTDVERRVRNAQVM